MYQCRFQQKLKFVENGILIHEHWHQVNFHSSLLASCIHIYFVKLAYLLKVYRIIIYQWGPPNKLVWPYTLSSRGKLLALSLLQHKSNFSSVSSVDQKGNFEFGKWEGHYKIIHFWLKNLILFPLYVTPPSQEGGPHER